MIFSQNNFRIILQSKQVSEKHEVRGWQHYQIGNKFRPSKGLGVLIQDSYISIKFSKVFEQNEIFLKHSLGIELII